MKNDYAENMVEVLYKTKKTMVCEKFKEVLPSHLIIEQQNRTKYQTNNDNNFLHETGIPMAANPLVQSDREWSATPRGRGLNVDLLHGRDRYSGSKG